MNQEFPTSARAIVIGGGAVGCSVLYHLAKSGWRDCVLLERHKLTSGTTWHSAAQVNQLRSSAEMTKLCMYSADLYSTLASETGQATGWRQCGNLNIAASPERLSHLKRTLSTARAFSVPVEFIDRDEVARLWPLLETEDIAGAIWSPTDGRVNPTDICQAMIKGARANGARVYEDTPVVSIESRGRRVASVLTPAGRIECDVVVNCGGLWGREIASLAGTAAPLSACEHFYILTEPIAGTHPNLPSVRDGDAHLYIREDVGGLLVGCFEPNPKSLPLEQLPKDVGFVLLDEDWDHFTPIMHGAMHRIPALKTAGIRMLLNGPESFTADHHPLLGEAPDMDGFFLACGMNSSGIALAGGVGMAIAEWIIHGEPPMDISSADIRRMAPFQNNLRVLAERIPEVLGSHYTIPWPGSEFATARNLRRTPFHYQHLANRACFTQRAGWERPAWFAPHGIELTPSKSFSRPNWFPFVADEHRAVREGVGIMDMTPFAKILVTGRGAASLLQRVCANNVDVEPGRVVYTGMLNKHGGFESDLSVMRLAEETYFLVTGALQETRDLAWLRRNVQEGERVAVVEQTSAWAVLGVMGPQSRVLLQRLTPQELSNEAFPFGAVKEIEVGQALVRAARMSYAGELGWEIYIPTEFACHIYEAILQVGRDLEPRSVGAYALNGLRLEKAFRAWGHDIGPTDTPLEAGLAFAVDFDKRIVFQGREALLRQLQGGINRRLLAFVFHDPDALPLGNEPILRDAQIVGRVSSAAFGHSLGAAVALGYVNGGDMDRQALLASAYEIEIAGVRYTATPHLRPPYDPKGVRLRLGS